MAYFQMEPRGEDRDDIRQAHANSLLLNAIRGLAGAKGEPLSLHDVYVGRLFEKSGTHDD